jgi:hypothetical protein
MENKNTMFGNEVSKKLVDRDVRIREQSATFLADHDKKIKSLTEDAEQAKLDAAMSNARFGYAATTQRSKDRVRVMNETIQYENNAATYGMTEMVAEVVEAGLLLDESELTKMLPTYKEDIRDTIAGLLKEGKINSDIEDKRTLALMEYVAKTLPSVKEGRTLTEEDLQRLVASNLPVDIDVSIKNLGSNVGERVANLLEKEQKQKKAVDDEVENAKAKAGVDTDANGEDDLSEIEAAIANGDLTQADVDDLLQSGEISEDEYNQLSELIAQSAGGVESEDPNAAPAEGEVPPEEAGAEGVPAEDPNAMAEQPAPEMGAEDPAMGGAAPMGAPAGVAPGMPKKQVQLLPDGTMNINVYESTLVRETPCTGLFESLAVNEARNMLKEGKEYDSDACLAKAVIYVTITEALDELGLINVTDTDYNRIITECGGCANPKNAKKVRAKMKKNSTPVSSKKEKGVAIKESAQLNEFCITSGPIMNRYNSDDMAERIRRKKLEREQQVLSEGFYGTSTAVKDARERKIRLNFLQKKKS